MTTCELVRVFNSFSKCADPNPCQRYARQFRKLNRAAQVRTAENILAGDDPETAIKDAKRYVSRGDTMRHVDKSHEYVIAAAKLAGKYEVLIAMQEDIRSMLQEPDEQQ